MIDDIEAMRIVEDCVKKEAKIYATKEGHFIDNEECDYCGDTFKKIECFQCGNGFWSILWCPRCAAIKRK